METPTLPDEQVRWAYDRHCEGYSLRKIAKALYVSEKTLRRALRRMGLVRDKAPLKYEGGITGLDE